MTNIEPVSPRRSEFVFIDAPERETLLSVYNFGKEDCSDVMVDARKFATAIKLLKEKLYQKQSEYDD